MILRSTHPHTFCTFYHHFNHFTSVFYRHACAICFETVKRSCQSHTRPVISSGQWYKLSLSHRVKKMADASSSYRQSYHVWWLKYLQTPYLPSFSGQCPSIGCVFLTSTNVKKTAKQKGTKRLVASPRLGTPSENCVSSNSRAMARRFKLKHSWVQYFH